MTQPFDPLVTIADFRAANPEIPSAIKDLQISNFLWEAAKVIWKAGVSISLNGTPKEIVEEVVTRRIGRDIGSISLYDPYDYGPFGYSYIELSQPILSLAKIEIKDQSVNPAVYLNNNPITDFRFQKNQKWIETITGIYLDPLWVNPNQTVLSEGRLVRVTYNTGIADVSSDAVAKADMLALISYLYQAHGLKLKANNNINDRLISEFKTDDVQYIYNNPGGVSVDQYFDNNPYFLSILSKYTAKNNRHLF